MTRVLLLDPVAERRAEFEGVLANAVQVCGSSGRLELAQSLVSNAKAELVVMAAQAGWRGVVEELEVPAIVHFSAAQDGAGVAAQAVLVGAHGCLEMPRHGGLELWLRSKLIPRLRGSLPKRRARVQHAAVRLVVVGSSTGGPEALVAVLSALPASFQAPIVIAQHMPEGFTDGLVRRLARSLRLPVRRGVEGMVLRPGQVYVAPGGSITSLQRSGARPALRVVSSDARGTPRPSVDALFTSASQHFGRSLLGLVLTGMGDDGCAGARKVRARGGRVYVQNESSSAVWGMPGAIVAARQADGVLSLKRLSETLINPNKMKGAA